MALNGICLRPARDFEWAGVKIPAALNIDFLAPELEHQIIESGKYAEFMIAPSLIPIGENLFTRLPRLKVVQLTGAGYDKIDLEAAARRGISVAHAPGQNSRSVAQCVFIMIGVIARRMLEADRMVRDNRFAEARKKLETPTLHEFGSQNLGIIGIGKIGQEVAGIGKYFGYNLGYYDVVRLAAETEAELDVQYYDFKALLGWADIISLHVPLTAATRGLIGAEEFKAMKSTAILINISRGGIVDEEALCRALENGRIWGAGIDVFAAEPPPASHAYFSLNAEIKNRLLLSPHMGGRTQEANRRAFSFALENVRSFLVDGKPLKCAVGSDNTIPEE